MITKDTLPQVLLTLGFISRKGVFSKSFGAAALVRVVPDPKQVLPLFLTLMMNSREFQQEAKGKASKSINQANINATIMRNIKVPVLPLAEQKRLVAAVEKLEKQITDAPARKQAIMQRYL